MDSREFKRVELVEPAFDDDDGDDSRLAMILDQATQPPPAPTPQEPTAHSAPAEAEEGDLDDELFGDDEDDDIGAIDLHLPRWSPLKGDQVTEAVSVVTGGIGDLLSQAESLLNRKRAQDAADLVQAALDQAPDNPRARAMLDDIGVQLDEEAFETLGDLDGYPKLRIHPNDIVSLAIDSKGAYLLMQIDGELTTSDLLELSPMGHAATARLLARFVTEEVIVVVPPDPWDPRRPR